MGYNPVTQKGWTYKIKKYGIFTASSDQKLFNEMKNVGVREVFKKPCSLDDLTDLIEKYRSRT